MATSELEMHLGSPFDLVKLGWKLLVSGVGILSRPLGVVLVKLREKTESLVGVGQFGGSDQPEERKVSEETLTPTLRALFAGTRAGVYSREDFFKYVNDATLCTLRTRYTDDHGEGQSTDESATPSRIRASIKTRTQPEIKKVGMECKSGKLSPNRRIIPVTVKAESCVWSHQLGRLVQSEENRDSADTSRPFSTSARDGVYSREELLRCADKAALRKLRTIYCIRPGENFGAARYVIEELDVPDLPKRFGEASPKRHGRRQKKKKSGEKWKVAHDGPIVSHNVKAESFGSLASSRLGQVSQSEEKSQVSADCSTPACQRLVGKNFGTTQHKIGELDVPNLPKTSRKRKLSHDAPTEAIPRVRHILQPVDARPKKLIYGDEYLMLIRINDPQIVAAISGLHARFTRKNANLHRCTTIKEALHVTLMRVRLRDKEQLDIVERCIHQVMKPFCAAGVSMQLRGVEIVSKQVAFIHARGSHLKRIRRQLLKEIQSRGIQVWQSERARVTQVMPPETALFVTLASVPRQDWGKLNFKPKKHFQTLHAAGNQLFGVQEVKCIEICRPCAGGYRTIKKVLYDIAPPPPLLPPPPSPPSPPPTKSQQVRPYLAIHIRNQQIIERVEAFQKKAVECEPAFNAFMRPLSSLHITLALINYDTGKTEPASIKEALCDAVTGFLDSTGGQELTVKFKGIELFSDYRGLYADVDESSQSWLSHLSDRIRRELEERGFKTNLFGEPHRFHMTLMLIPTNQGTQVGREVFDALRDYRYVFGKETVDEIQLFGRRREKDDFYRVPTTMRANDGSEWALKANKEIEVHLYHNS